MRQYAYRLGSAPTDDPSLYAHFARAEEEVELIHAELPGPCRVLDLGSGNGRIAAPLAALGHRVTAVDCSARMLASLKDVETVCTRIESLQLYRCFDAVLLASHLVNAAEPALRLGFLDTIRRHLAHDGRAFVQYFTVEGTKGLKPGMAWHFGDVSMTVRRAKFKGGQFDLRLEYENPYGRWIEHACGDLLEEEELEKTFARAGLCVNRRLGSQNEWVVLRHAPAETSHWRHD